GKEAASPPPGVLAPLPHGLGAGGRLPERDAEVPELELVDGGRRPRARIGTRLRLRVRDHLADVLLTGQDGDQPVDAEGEARVWRRAEPERVAQEPETRPTPTGLDR